MTFLNHFLPGACVLLLIGTLFGCSPEDDASTLGDWTLKESPLRLTEDLLVSETDAFYLGSIVGQKTPTPGPGLDVLSDGRMVVADADAKNVKLLRPDGSLIDTLGGPGQGPGEFRRLMSVQVARGDSIYAYADNRLTVFAPEPPHSVARILTLEAKPLPPFQVLVTDAHVSGLWGTPFMANKDVNEDTWQPWRPVTDGGAPGDTLFTVRMQRMASVQRDDERFSLYPVPYSRTMPVTTGPDQRLYVGHLDSLHVTAYRPDGSAQDVASVPAPPVPVTEADRDSVLTDIGNATLRKKLASGLPDTKPAITDLVVADDGRLWVRRPPEDPDADTAPWWILDPDAKTIRKARLPANVNLAAVRDGKAYGTTQTEMGAPAVVRYRIES